MKNLILFLSIIAIIISGRTFAQDINTIFNNNLTLDAHLSKQTRAINGLMASYGEINTQIYSYKGSFEEALNNMKTPQNADVSTVTNQPLGTNINMVVMLTENMDPKPMNESWYAKAKERSNELDNHPVKSLSIRIISPREQNPEDLKAGDKVKLRVITLSNPYLDLDNLKVIEGTWVSDVVATSVITQEMLDTEAAFEDDWEEVEKDMGVDVPEGAHFVALDVVADTQFLQGDVNYIVEISTGEAVNFYKKSKERFMSDFEQLELITEEGGMITTFYLLEHDGPLKKGDDVISMTIQPAPKSVLSDVLGLNQGTWSLISINRWVEEGY